MPRRIHVIPDEIREEYLAAMRELVKEQNKSNARIFTIEKKGVRRRYFFPLDDMERAYQGWIPSDEQAKEGRNKWIAFEAEGGCDTSEMEKAIRMNMRLVHTKEYKAKYLAKVAKNLK